MKKILGTCAILFVMNSLSAFAASDIYLKITDAQGSSQLVKCPDGACVVNNLKKGKYDLAVEFHPYQQTSKDEGGARKSAIEPLEFNASVVSPRDAASGMPTGRRQYAPVIIRKDMVTGTQVVVTEDGSSLSIVGIGGVASSSQPATKIERKIK